ncbi:MAG TPA: potassium-transporting ATPase subunit C [Thermoplasmata archaeon]|nr:potassium-transporting ATPase subunit C [Thermoplasmata archaeon]
MAAPTQTPPRSPPRRRVPFGLGRHLRASVAFLFLTILTVSLAYPIALVGFGELVDPSAANGSLTYYANGTVNGSSLLPPNTTATHGGVAFGSSPAAPVTSTLGWTAPARGAEPDALSSDHERLSASGGWAPRIGAEARAGTTGMGD